MIYVYLDESGDTSSSPSFVVCMFFTKEPQFWTNVIKTARKKNKYPYELKFHKISENIRNGRYRMCLDVFNSLIKHQNKFYCRSIVVGRKLINKVFFSKSDQIEYNYFIEQLVLYYTEKLTDDAKLFLDERCRERYDNFIPNKLQSILDIRTVLEGTKKVKLFIEDSKNSELLQLTDLVVGAIRQCFFPSKNRNKKELSEILSKLFNKNIYLWHWKPGKR